MSIVQSEHRAHNVTCNTAEGVRQTAVAAAGGNQTAVRTAEIAFHRAVASSAIANGLSPVFALTALRELGQTGP